MYEIPGLSITHCNILERGKGTSVKKRLKEIVSYRTCQVEGNILVKIEQLLKKTEGTVEAAILSVKDRKASNPAWRQEDGGPA